MNILRPVAFKAALMSATLLLSIWGAAHGQIAAPPLLPGFVTDNPAVIQWHGPSRIGVGHSEATSEKTDSLTPNTTTDGESSGNLAGVVLSGEFLSFAAQAFQVEGTEGDSLTLDYSVASAGLAIPIGDFLTLGVGQETADIKLDFKGALDASLELESSLPIAGASLRLGELFYLGGAVGKETIKVTQSVPAIPVLNFETEFERDVHYLGVGIHDNEGVKWHLEVGTKVKESAETLVSGNTLPLEKSEETFAVIEVNSGGVLVGFQSRTLEESNESVLPTTVTVEEKSQNVHVGWVPEMGWSIILIGGTSEREEGTETKEEASFTALLAFLF